MTGIHWTSVVVIGSVVGILAFGGFAPPIGGPGGGTGGGGTPSTVYLNLSIVPGAYPGTYAYNLTSVRLPHATPIVLTVTNFDPRAGPLARPADAEVIGGMTGVAQFHQGNFYFVGHVLSMTGVSHTFSIRTSGLYLNLPVPPSLGGVLPSSATFTFVVPSVGPYPYSCVVLTSMGIPGLHGMIYST